MKLRTRCLFIAVFFLMFAVAGCVPVILPPGVVRAEPPSNIEDPDKYRVDSANYQIFRIKEKFDPPRWKAGAGESKYPMVTIEPADIWKVTYVVKDIYLIYSDTYNDRQCRLLAQIAPNGSAGGFISRWGGSKCHSDYLYHIPIIPNGTVKGGWKLLYNPDRIGFRRDRYVNMQIDQTTSVDWGAQPLFNVIQPTWK